MKTSLMTLLMLMSFSTAFGQDIKVSLDGPTTYYVLQSCTVSWDPVAANQAVIDGEIAGYRVETSDTPTGPFVPQVTAVPPATSVPCARANLMATETDGPTTKYVHVIAIDRAGREALASPRVAAVVYPHAQPFPVQGVTIQTITTTTTVIQSPE